MRTKIFAALAVVSAVAVAGLPGTASARNGRLGGGGMHVGGGAHFGGAHFGGARFGGARFGAAPLGGVRAAHFGGSRAIGANWNRGWAHPGWRGAAWRGGAWHGAWRGGGHRWHGRRGWGWGWPVAGVALGGWAFDNYYGDYDPAYECYDTIRVWTPRGWRWRQVWVCD